MTIGRPPGHAPSPESPSPESPSPESASSSAPSSGPPPSDPSPSGPPPSSPPSRATPGARTASARPRAVVGVGRGAGAPLDTLTLPHAERHLRRKALTCDGGLRVALDLPAARRFRDREGLLLAAADEGADEGAGGGADRRADKGADGRPWVELRAAPERCLAVEGADAAELAVLAWHLGNRHAPTALVGGRILVEHDPVLARMLEGLGARPREVTEPFEPIAGAYHDHRHAHSHAHPHAYSHAGAPDHAAGHPHAGAHVRAHLHGQVDAHADAAPEPTPGAFASPPDDPPGRQSDGRDRRRGDA